MVRLIHLIDRIEKKLKKVLDQPINTVYQQPRFVHNYETTYPNKSYNDIKENLNSIQFINKKWENSIYKNNNTLNLAKLSWEQHKAKQVYIESVEAYNKAKLLKDFDKSKLKNLYEDAKLKKNTLTNIKSSIDNLEILIREQGNRDETNARLL